MRIFVTGAAGFGAAGLIDRLAAAGHSVTACDVVAPEEAWRLRALIDEGDIAYLWRSVQDLSHRDLDGAERVVHMAAVADVSAGHHSPEYTFAQNVAPTVHLLECVRAASLGADPLVVLAGTAHELEAAGDQVLDEDSPIQPGTPYGVSKACQEVILRGYGHCYGIPWAVMRNGIVAGRHMRRQIAPYLWCRRILRDLPVELHGRGEQTRDLTDARDTAEAWTRALQLPAARVRGHVLQVSRGIEITVAEMLEMCYRACEKIIGRPIARAIEHRDDRPGERGMRERFDCRRTREILGWEPRYSPEETIREVAAWAAEEAGLLEPSPAIRL